MDSDGLMVFTLLLREPNFLRQNQESCTKSINCNATIESPETIYFKAGMSLELVLSFSIALGAGLDVSHEDGEEDQELSEEEMKYKHSHCTTQA